MEDRRHRRSRSPPSPGSSHGGEIIMRGDYQQQQRKRQRMDDDRGGIAPLSHPQQQGHRDDRAGRLERERRERMARLRADDGGDGVVTTVPSTEASRISSVGGGAGGRGLGRGKSTLGDTQQNNESGDTIANTARKYQDNDDENYRDQFREKSIDDSNEIDEEEQIRIMMGFGGFATTKGKAVADNQHGAARGAASKNKGRKYRQYMNRKGGFNRPLDKMN